MSKLEGGCLCGAVRYSSDAAPVLTAVCHCKNCQRQSGTAFSVVIGLPRGSLVFTGEAPRLYADTGDSGLPVRRRFCAACGSPIVSEPEATPGVDWLKAGTLDDTSWLQPQMNVWCDSAQPWVHISEAIPRAGKNPPLG